MKKSDPRWEMILLNSCRFLVKTELNRLNENMTQKLELWGGGAGEMAQWLRALDALAEDLGSIQHPHGGSPFLIVVKYC